jgi:hypothetical protein
MKAQNQKSGIAGGIFLIGIGVLIITGTWWPGIMFVSGLAIGAERAFHRNYAQALAAAAACFAIGLLSAAEIPWNVFGPFILISLGAVVLVQGVATRQN